MLKQAMLTHYASWLYQISINKRSSDMKAVKKSQLSSAEALQDKKRYQKLDDSQWKQTFYELIQQVGKMSKGGNSVHEIISERER